MATRVGPTLTLVASCLDCDHLRLDCDVYRCVHPKASSVAEPMICSAHREPRAPAWCPELPGARLAMAREIVAGAVDDTPAVGSGIPSRGETAECGPGPGVPVYATDIERAKCMFRARLTLQRIERERREASRVYVETADDESAREAQKESE